MLYFQDLMGRMLFWQTHNNDIFPEDLLTPLLDMRHGATRVISTFFLFLAVISLMFSFRPWMITSSRVKGRSDEGVRLGKGRKCSVVLRKW